MKRITMLALGSRGDVQPYTALGRALMEAGYHVRVATFEDFEPLVRGQGLDFHPVKADAQLLVQQAAGSGLNTRNIFKMMRSIRQTYGQLFEAYEEAFGSEVLFDSDAILTQIPGAIYGRDLAEKLHVPHIVASVIPLTPTRAFPLVVIPVRAYGGLLNRASYTLGETLVWSMFRPTVSRFRRALGLSPASLLYPPLRDPILNGFSTRVVPRPADWNERVHVTGWWILPEPDWTPPPALVEFLAAGAPPVFAGFGSMIAPDPAALTRLLIEAFQRAGVRGVISSGWAKLGGDLPPGFLAVDYVPYAWLFPQMAAVIHHGGSGTTGFALRSGVPSMVVSFTADQPYWGERTRALGVGARSIPVTKLTADALADSIRRMTSDSAMRERAAALGAALRAEDGIGEAVRIIRGIVGDPSG